MRTGYLKQCDGCSRMIYMKLDYDGIYRPYESWLDGPVEEGEWQLHQCATEHRGPPPTPVTNPRVTTRPTQEVCSQNFAGALSLDECLRRLQAEGMPLAVAVKLMAALADAMSVARGHLADPAKQLAEICRTLEKHAASENSSKTVAKDSATSQQIQDIPF